MIPKRRKPTVFGRTMWLVIVWAAFACGGEAGHQPAVDKSTSKATVEQTDRAPLDYLELFTGGAKAAQNPPLVFAVHGLGDRPEAFKGLMEDLPSKARVIVPRAPKPWGPGHSWFDVKIPYSSNEKMLGHGMGKAAGQIADLIGYLNKSNTNEKAPVITGFSQGGMLSFAVAIQHPQVVGLAVPISGALPQSLIPAQAGPYPPIRAIHGDSDDIVPARYDRATVEALVGLGVDATLQECEGVGHTVSAAMRARMYREISVYLKAQ